MNRSRLDMNTAIASTPTTAAVSSLGSAPATADAGDRLRSALGGPPGVSSDPGRTVALTEQVSPDIGLIALDSGHGGTGGTPRLLHRPHARGGRREVGAAGRARGLPGQPPLRRDGPAHRRSAGHADGPAPRAGRRRHPAALPVQRPPAAFRVRPDDRRAGSLPGDPDPAALG